MVSSMIERIKAHVAAREAHRARHHWGCADDPFICWSCDEFSCGDIDENDKWVRDDCDCPCHDTGPLLSEVEADNARLRALITGYVEATAPPWDPKKATRARLAYDALREEANR